MKNGIKILTILILTISLTGCATALKDSKNKAVMFPKTGQALYKNVLCQPTNQKVLDIYTKNAVVNHININKLPKCSEFKINDGGYEGIWTSFFVKPLAFFILKIGQLVKSMGLAIIIAGLLIRVATIPITKKTALQSENMKKAQPEISKLEEKYKDKKDQEGSMQKSQETMMIYKKYGINPLFGCIFALLQLPLFFAFYEAINRVPAIFEQNFLTLQLGTTPIVGIQTGNILYILLIGLIIWTTYYSFKLSASSTSAEQQKQMKIMTIVMMVFISFASLTLPAAIALYWITSSGFTIVQTTLLKRKVNK